MHNRNENPQTFSFDITGLLEKLGVLKPRVRLAEVRIYPARPDVNRRTDPPRRVRDANLPYRR